MTLHFSLMLAVEDAGEAAAWYKRALGATELWSLGSVVGLRIGEAPFFLHEPTDRGFVSPAASGSTTVRVEVFADDPDAFVRRAGRELLTNRNIAPRDTRQTGENVLARGEAERTGNGNGEPNLASAGGNPCCALAEEATG